MVTEPEQSDSYDALLADATALIRQARANAQIAVIAEMARLHRQLASGELFDGERVEDQAFPVDSDLVREMANDPFLLDLLRVSPPLTPGSSSRPPEHAIVSTLEQYLLGLRAGFALAGAPRRLVTVDEGVVSIDLLFFHIPTMRYIAIVVDDQGPMDRVIDETLRISRLVDATDRGDHNDTIGIAILATSGGPIVRYVYPDTIDEATKSAMIDEDHLAHVLAAAINVDGT